MFYLNTRSYRAVSTLHVCYKNPSVNAVYTTFTVYSGVHVKHINALCGQYVELLNVTPDDSYSTR